MPTPFVFQPLTDSIAVAGRNTCRRDLLGSTKQLNTCSSTAWLQYGSGATVEARRLQIHGRVSTSFATESFQARTLRIPIRVHTGRVGFILFLFKYIA